MSRILLIEDDAIVRESIAEILGREGYEIIQREDGIELTQLLKSQSFDVIITDLKLPGLNGIELIREIRKEPSDSEIIIITGYGTMQSAIDALQLGVYDYINKPFEPAVMLNAVKHAVERVELQRQKAEAEKTIKALSDFNEEILESSPEAIVVLDRNIVCRYWNSAAEKISGIARKNIQGKDLVREKVWILGQNFPKQFQEVLNGNVAEKLIEVTSSGKKTITLRQKLSPLRDPEGKVKGILLFITDATHIKTAESKTDDIKRRKDSGFRKEICLSGIDKEGTTASSMSAFFNDSLRHIYNSFQIRKGLKTEIIFDSKKYTCGKTSGESKTFETEFDAGILGKGVLIIGYGETEVSEDDQDLIKSAAARIGGEIIKRFIARNEQYNKCMESIGRLAGGLAHNLNNILGGILGYASFIKSEIPKNSPLQTHLSTIEESSNLAAQITSQLLDMNRDIGKGNEVIDINDNVKRVAGLLHVFFDRNIIVSTRFYPRLHYVKGDSSKIDRVFINICINAREAMHTGGRLNIQTGNLKLEKESKSIGLRPGDYVLISFADSGIGMEEEALNNCFDPFYSTKGLGYGLGLSSAYGIIRAHGGQIQIQSAKGAGTKVTIYLPAASKGSIEKDSLIRQGSLGKILIVENDDIIRKMTSEILFKLGYSIIAADTWGKALSILDKHPKDIKVIILDTLLPEIDYSKIYDKIRKTAGHAGIILSGGDKLPAEAQGKANANRTFFLQKPYNMEGLSEAIQKAIRHGAKKRRKT